MKKKYKQRSMHFRSILFALLLTRLKHPLYDTTIVWQIWNSTTFPLIHLLMVKGRNFKSIETTLSHKMFFALYAIASFMHSILSFICLVDSRMIYTCVLHSIATPNKRTATNKIKLKWKERNTAWKKRFNIHNFMRVILEKRHFRSVLSCLVCCKCNL